MGNVSHFHSRHYEIRLALLYVKFNPRGILWD